MGWFLAVAAPEGHPARAHRLDERYAAGFESDTATLRVVGGGAPRTFRARHDGEAVAVVSGIGVRTADAGDGAVSTLVPDEALLAAATARALPPPLGGGLAALAHDGGTLWAASDALGLRNLYAARLGPDAVAVATHLDLLAPLLPRVQVEAQALAGYLAGVHQLSHRALLAGIERLGPGGTLRFDGARLAIERHPWTEARIDAHPLGTVARLRDADGARPPLTLGLSGGFDSRVLLSHLLDDRADLRLHTFGQATHPDVETAHEIARRIGAPLRHFPPPEDDADRLLDALVRWAVPTNGVTPASSAPRFVFAAPEATDTRLGVDGGFGEIGRGVFFKHFALSRLLRPHAPPTAYLQDVAHAPGWLAPGLDAPVADDLAEALAALPRFRRADVRRWMARFAIHTLLPNTYGYAQDGYDLFAPMLMPSALPAFLAAVVARPGDPRRTGYAVREDLRTIPLVKGTVRIRFSDRLLVQTWRVRRQTARPVPPMHRFAVRFLRTMEPVVRDWAASESARASGLYDTAWLDRAVEAFYRGDDAPASSLDAWLAFEAFRRSTGARR